MLRIAVIGCGTMAESHFLQISRIPYAKLVGVCDSELLMAKQVTLRHNVNNYFDNIDEMIEKTQPDIIHIVTPPDSHYNLAKKCLEKGIHVYIEKPFTVFHREAEDIIKIANNKGLKVTVGHNAQFSPVALAMRKLINEGYIGGDPIHMDSIYCYNWGNINYAKAIIENNNHWVNNLPGKLLQNIISHGISKIAEYLKTDIPNISIQAFQSPFIKKFKDSTIIDELRLIISDNKTTGYFTFSSTIKPLIHSFRVYGPEKSLEIDHNRQTLIINKDEGYKSYMRYVNEPFKIAKQYKNNAWKNLRGLIKKEIRGDYGIYYLIDKFYKSILGENPVPIPYREILLVSKIMENVFIKIYEK